MKKKIFFIASFFVIFLIMFVIFMPFNKTKIKSNKITINFNNIKKEIKWFIKEVNEGSNTVYAVKIYENNADYQYCITIGYRKCNLQLKHFENFKYYTYIKKDLVVIDYSEDFSCKYELKNAKDIHLLTDKQIISDKVFQDIAIIGTYPSYVCCFKEGNIKRTFYENDDDIPLNQQIFLDLSTGTR